MQEGTASTFLWIPLLLAMNGRPAEKTKRVDGLRARNEAEYGCEVGPLGSGSCSTAVQEFSSVAVE